ncbi:MAG: ABC transporter ATP-binding protein [Chloroflexota bacterium]
MSAIAGNPIIETSAFHKAYGRIIALEGLDLAVPESAVGLLGANGAGKSTLIKGLLGLLQPTSGTASVLGKPVTTHASEIREQVGYMPESETLPSDVTASDFVGHMAEMSGLPRRAARQRANDVLYQVGLDEERYRPIGEFSTGMKQRVKLAQAIVHDPDLVFLDEPTNGMDPQGRDEMLDLIARIHNDLGITVVLSSHILGDVERVCDYVVMLDEGRLVIAGDIANLRSGGTDIVVRVDGDERDFLSRLDSHGIRARRESQEILIERSGDQVFDIIRDAVVDSGCSLRQLRGRERTLEDVYIQTVSGEPTSDEVAEAADGD